MLRNEKVPDLPQPYRGVNLRDAPHTLESGEVSRMQNLLWDGFIRVIPGVTRLTPSALQASVRIRGGHRYYRADGTAFRLVAYGMTIASIDEAGAALVLTNLRTNDLNTYFRTWPSTDTVYASNGSDVLWYFDGLVSGTVTGTNIPTPIGRVVVILDRMMAITTNGIERTDSLVDNVWSSNSAWATLRPARPGYFTTLHPHTLIGTDSQEPGALAFQANAYYHIAGTDFGTDVTAGTASTDEDSSITLIDSTVGTSSPKSVVTIPEIGTAWFTSDGNVYFIPEGSLHGRYVGDKLRSSGPVKGTESLNYAAIDKVWMEYFDRKLILGFPTGGSTYPDTQYWLDVRHLLSIDQMNLVPWYGPMIVDTWGDVWREDQAGENRLMAGEGNASTGAYIYNIYQTQLKGHAQGSSTVYPTCIYEDRHLKLDTGKGSKYTPNFRITAAISGGSIRGGVVELGSQVLLQQAFDAYTP